MKRKLFLTGTLILLFFSNAWSQVTIDAEFRPRTEYRDGFRKPIADTLNPALLTVQRTRLNFDYKSASINARLSLQDAHVWGNSDTKTNASLLSIYEAWCEYLVSSGFSAKFGRQPLRYDDQRIFAAPDWSAVGIAHDILLLKYNISGFQAHSGLAYSNAKDTLVDAAYSYAAVKTYKTMAFGWVSKTLFTGTTATAIGVWEGFENPTNFKKNYSRFTYGGNLIFNTLSDNLSGIATAYLQQGNDMTKASGTGFADLNAHFLAFKINYKLTDKYTTNLGMDMYSGSKATIEANKSTTFNRLYGALHSYNGFMEYFTKLPTQGLTDYYIGFSVKVTNDFSAELTGHWFYFDETFVFAQQEQEKALGSELDLTLKYSVSKIITLQGGYS